MVVLFASLAALGFAVASVGQQHVANSMPSEDALRAGLMVRLAKNWRWMAATGVDVAAFGLEAIALGVGSLVVVQSILPASLLFALPLGAAIAGRRMTRQEWLGAMGVAGGIVVFLIAGSPSPGQSQASGRVWWTLIAIVVTLVGSVVVVGIRAAAPWVKAGCWAVAGAVTYALMTAVTKSAVDLLDGGVFAVVMSWQLYVVILSAGLGTLFVQSAFQAGSLSATMPILVMMEPVSGALIGTIVFAERLSIDPFRVAAMAAAMIAMLVGVVTLSRSPLARFLA